MHLHCEPICRCWSLQAGWSMNLFQENILSAIILAHSMEQTLPALIMFFLIYPRSRWHYTPNPSLYQMVCAEDWWSIIKWLQTCNISPTDMDVRFNKAVGLHHPRSMQHHITHADVEQGIEGELVNLQRQFSIKQVRSWANEVILTIQFTLYSEVWKAPQVYCGLTCTVKAWKTLIWPKTLMTSHLG